jgi:hypothetical protein
MKTEDQANLESLLDAFDEKLARSKDQKDRRHAEEEAFFVEFQRLRTKVMRPALTDISAYLEARGHSCEIVEVGDERNKRDAKLTMRITIGGIPTSAYMTENTVSVSFMQSGQATISIQAEIPNKNRNKFAGLRGTYTPPEISADLIHKKLIEVLEEVFTPK